MTGRAVRSLDARARGETILLSEEQIRLLERHSTDFRIRYVESSRPGELLNQDTFYRGTLKGLSKVYVQVVVDTFCSLAFAKIYNGKMPITACDLLYEWKPFKWTATTESILAKLSQLCKVINGTQH